VATNADHWHPDFVMKLWITFHPQLTPVPSRQVFIMLAWETEHAVQFGRRALLKPPLRRRFTRKRRISSTTSPRRCRRQPVSQSHARLAGLPKPNAILARSIQCSGYMALWGGPAPVPVEGAEGVHAVSGRGTAIGPGHRNPASYPTGAQARSPLSSPTERQTGGSRGASRSATRAWRASRRQQGANERRV
jgi:hypothetical protein